MVKMMLLSPVNRFVLITEAGEVLQKVFHCFVSFCRNPTSSATMVTPSITAGSLSSSGILYLQAIALSKVCNNDTNSYVLERDKNSLQHSVAEVDTLRRLPSS